MIQATASIRKFGGFCDTNQEQMTESIEEWQWVSSPSGNLPEWTETSTLDINITKETK